MAAAAENEVARNLLDVGNKLLSPPSDIEELLKLLNLAEDFLSQVEQAPPVSLNTALYRVLKALVAKDLLNHSEIDVKIALASCFSEITFITAPAHPYNEDLMKDIFRIIVDALKNIDDSSSCTYYKRVSILETIAKVHSCVLMLDLDCDDLILEMFQHFLRTITLNKAKERAPMWEHCEKVAGNGRWRVKCLHCSKIVSNPGRMKHHLARTGNGTVEPCTRASEEVEKLFRDMVSLIKPREYFTSLDMVNGKDATWKHCKTVDGYPWKLKCVHCSRIIYGITRMKYHLARAKNKNPCLSCPKQVKKFFFNMISRLEPRQ